MDQNGEAKKSHCGRTLKKGQKAEHQDENGEL